jgi:hypothetical protein
MPGLMKLIDASLEKLKKEAKDSKPSSPAGKDKGAKDDKVAQTVQDCLHSWEL